MVLNSTSYALDTLRTLSPPPAFGTPWTLKGVMEGTVEFFGAMCYNACGVAFFSMIIQKSRHDTGFLN